MSNSLGNIMGMSETRQRMFPNDLFDKVKNEIIELLKSLDRENFPAINSFNLKFTNIYKGFVSEFIGESIRDFNKTLIEDQNEDNLEA